MCIQYTSIDVYALSSIHNYLLFPRDMRPASLASPPYSKEKTSPGQNPDHQVSLHVISSVGQEMNLHESLPVLKGIPIYPNVFIE